MGSGGTTTVDELVDLVVASPLRAGTKARQLLQAAPVGDRDAARLHWVIGRSERESGHLDRACEHLEEALAVAGTLDDAELLISIHSSLAFTLARQGDLDGAEKLLDAAEQLAEPVERARLMAQRGGVIYLRGDLARGADVVGSACEQLRRHGDLVHEARHRANLGTILSDLGRYGATRRQLSRSVAMAERLGLDVVVASARSSLGYVLTLQGDLPGAMRQFAESERRHVQADAPSYLPTLHANHAKALADAALLDDADALLDRALAMFRANGQMTELPGCLVRAAEVRLARGDLTRAELAATEAVELFTQQRRAGWVVNATNLALQIRARREGASDSLVAELRRTAQQLEGYGWIGQALRARLVAARLEAEAGRTGAASAPGLRRAARLGPHADRILLAYVDAVAALNAGERGRARRAITRGLGVAIAAQAGLGAMEARAHAARHGYDLTALGARMALEDRRPRELLERIEATRLMSSRMPMLRPPDDDAMAAMLTELRGLEVHIADATTPANRRVEDERQRVELERRVIHHARGVRGDLAARSSAWERELSEALAMLGQRRLLAYAHVDERLVVVSVFRGRSRVHELGPPAGVGRCLDAIAFALHRLNRRQGSNESKRAALDLLRVSTGELATRLLPHDVRVGDEPLVVVPTARLHDVPWGLLPSLAGRAVSVDPSISAWAAAERMRLDRLAIHGGDRAAGLIAGPGLEHTATEIATVRGFYADPIVLDRDRSTVLRCLELVARSDVVHFACHGSFRTDNPMFSSLGMIDGPLVVYDFERLPRFPETVVLSACSTANARVLHGGSLLGLAAALIALGVANVIAPLVPISDLSSGEVISTRVHRSLAGGSSPAESLAGAVLAAGVGSPTAGAFVSLGA